MSKSLAKQTSKALVWILLVLLILGLGGFGVANFGGSVTTIGTVGKTEISTDTYARALQRELNAQQASTGTPMSIAQAQQNGLVEAVRAQVIAEAALDNEMARLGVSVGDERVAREVMAVPAFQGPDGAFDRDAYRFTLEQNGLTETGFEDSIRKDTARSLLQAAIVAGLAAPEAYAETIYHFIAERRSAQLIALDISDLDQPIPAPGTDEIAAQYAATPGAYTAPRIRQITYAWLTPEMMLDRIEPDEQMLRDLYAERIDEFVQPERRLVERLAFPTEQAAADAFAAIEAGQSDFDDAVAARGLKLADVDLGDVTQADIGGAAGAAVFALDEPGIAGPVMSDLGPALFRVNAILAARETRFEEARETLADETARDRAERLILDAITDYEDRLAAGATLEELARETDMELGRIDYSVQAEDEIAAYTAFREAAETVSQGDFPEILELEDGGLFALRLDAEIQPTLRPLDEVRDEVIADWRAAQASTRLNEMAEALKLRLAAGEQLEALGHEVTYEQGLSRGGLTPPELAQALFGLQQPGEVVVVTAQENAWLIRLDAILPPAADDPTAEFLLGTLSQQAAQGIAQDLYGYFAQALVNTAGLSLDQAAINAVHAQFR
ncbi:peptidyl-prolyl cis-trans isomerase D [Rhodovulum bhavnagarense]|uniref:Peptidyl-prolyl cis-trans isomerase D n=1 Tax=Rhodovulum bhavnagarense TaxID=992286 RepID=A0A4R2RHC7_9RHOB|nr:peptidylprolyl isomerase [Rhodovulum bhavnagarense]TCP62018.1 peptidyl-prolyl cis-trans isomerase D [Rhodovulum bhavnagarense]